MRKPGIRGRRSTTGQGLVEFALVLPLLFLLIVNVVNFGGMLFAWITIANAARTGADYLIMGVSSATVSSAPTISTVQTLVQQDLESLPNSSTANVRVCTYAATPNCVGTGTATVPADPESSTLYLTGLVEVTYTYTPLISLWSFPRLGIRATLPPTTIHRYAVMRIEGGA